MNVLARALVLALVGRPANHYELVGDAWRYVEPTTWPRFFDRRGTTYEMRDDAVWVLR